MPTPASITARRPCPPDGRWLAVIGTRPNPPTREGVVYDLRRGRGVARLAVDSGTLWDLCFSDDGNTLQGLVLDHFLSPRWPNVKGGTLYSWDTRTWEERPRRPFAPRPAGVIDVSPDGRTVVSVRQDQADRDLSVWDVDRPEPLAVHDAPPSSPKPWVIQFVEGGRTVAVGTVDGTVELWDLATRTRRANLPVHSKDYVARKILLAPGSPFLVSSATFMGPPSVWFQPRRWVARQLRRPFIPPVRVETVVWDLKTNRRLFTSSAEIAWFLTPDGSTLITFGPDQPVRSRAMPAVPKTGCP